MNYVTPNRVELDQVEKEGTEKGIVIFCCALFLLFQIASTYSTSSFPPPYTAQLIAVSPQSLQLATITEQAQTFSLSRPGSSGNYHFSPFFFEPIAINYCDKTLLMSIKGIGPSLAENILATRNEIGSFKTPEDLLQVKGIGPSRLLQFSSYFTFSSADSEKM